MARLLFSVFAVFLVFKTYWVYAESTCYDVSRSEWGAQSPRKTRDFSSTPSKVAIHHSATWPCSSTISCIERVKTIQGIHLNDPNIENDIAYNFLIGGDGQVYEGRGWDVEGDQVKYHNGYTIGICFIGNFKYSVPSDAMFNAAKNLIQCGKDEGKLRWNAEIEGHRNFGRASTDCPGTILGLIEEKLQ